MRITVQGKWDILRKLFVTCTSFVWSSLTVESGYSLLSSCLMILSIFSFCWMDEIWDCELVTVISSIQYEIQQSWITLMTRSGVVIKEMRVKFNQKYVTNVIESINWRRSHCMTDWDWLRWCWNGRGQNFQYLRYNKYNVIYVSKT